MVGDVMIYEIILNNGRKVEVKGKDYEITNDRILKIRAKNSFSRFYSAMFNFNSIAGIVSREEWGEDDDSDD